MKSFKYLTIAIVAICLASCGSKSSSSSDDSFDVTVDNTTSGGSISSSEDSEDSSVSSEESSDDEESISSSSSGSQDWDALLNSYEQYVDKYISYMKKAAKGDMSALAEYPALMEKAQEFSEKIENAQEDMSASQWARYLKITNKMTKAAQEMR